MGGQTGKCQTPSQAYENGTILQSGGDICGAQGKGLGDLKAINGRLWWIESGFTNIRE